MFAAPYGQAAQPGVRETHGQFNDLEAEWERSTLTEQAIRHAVSQGHRRASTPGRPVWHEEASYVLLDGDPVIRIVWSFKRRDEGLAVVLVVASLATVLLNEGTHVAERP